MLVVDASVAVKLLTEEDGSEGAALLVSSEVDVLVPDLIDLEVASALSKKVRYHDLPDTQARDGMRAMACARCQISSPNMLPRNR